MLFLSSWQSTESHEKAPGGGTESGDDEDGWRPLKTHPGYRNTAPVVPQSAGPLHESEQVFAP